jgi:transposase
LQSGSFAWPREDTGSLVLSREQFDWLVAGLPWQRLGAAQPHAITAI